MSSVGEILKNYREKIAPLDLELILENALKKPRSFIIAHPEYCIPKFKISNLKFKINQRIKGIPLAYILGHKEFYGLDFKINKNALVPRPETEMMVEEAMNRVTHNAQRVTLVDVGTGSGCIIIALLKQLNFKKQIFPPQRDPAKAVASFKFIGVDISKKALNIARQNAKTHGVAGKIKFLHGDLLEPILKISNFKFQISNFIVLANLPYLTPAQIKESPTIRYEPKLALSAGLDGLKYYRRLLKQIRQFLNSRVFAPHSRLFLMLEIDSSQTKKIKQLIKKELPQAAVQIKKDLRGHNRLVTIQSPASCSR